MKTIDGFFKRKNVEKRDCASNDEDVIPKVQKIEEEFDINKIQRDPGERQQISKYPPHIRDEVRRAYMKLGPFQPKGPYRKIKSGKQSRKFQESWFKLFPSWLEYSPEKNAVFCLPCFLFRKDNAPSATNAFTVTGFDTWKKVRNGAKCAFLTHIGKDANSTHNKAEKAWKDLLDQSCHIANNFQKFMTQNIKDNRIRLKTTIDVIRWLTKQGFALRGHDESEASLNRGNFLELRSLIASYNPQVDEVLKKSPGNAIYYSPNVQKEILQVVGNKMKKSIREEIGDAKYCLLVDEARDISKNEQMSIVLRYVDRDGFVQERFFGLVHIRDTKALTLRDNILELLSRHNLDVMSIRGQGYDGASNMRGEFKGLQALISQECPQAYFVHCFAHRLQLALVSASHGVNHVNRFFINLGQIINVVGGSCKRSDQLKAAHVSNVEFLLDIGELESGSGQNQIGSLQRAGNTRWSSHLKSISSLLNMYSATCEVLMVLIEEGDGQAEIAHESLTSIEFVFIMHIMLRILEISDTLCQALQLQSQDILNAMALVSRTKEVLQELRDDGWEKLVHDVRLFCEKVSLEFPDLTAFHKPRRGKPRHQQEKTTEERYYKACIFFVAIDTQLHELKYRFNDSATELMILSSALDLREMRLSFRVDDICKLVHKFYPSDFIEYELVQLRPEVVQFAQVLKHSEFHELETPSDLSQWMTKTRWSKTCPLVYRVITLVLTLPVSTATTERSFSAMSIVKNTRRNRMEDDFLSDSLLLYIEKELALQIRTDFVIDDFRNMKERRSQF